jgi:hypothetical protein
MAWHGIEVKVCARLWARKLSYLSGIASSHNEFKEDLETHGEVKTYSSAMEGIKFEFDFQDQESSTFAKTQPWFETQVSVLQSLFYL